ncbi:MAG: hypothetical protein ACODAG_12625 [Myxococcota bacterium]
MSAETRLAEVFLSLWGKDLDHAGRQVFIEAVAGDGGGRGDASGSAHYEDATPQSAWEESLNRAWDRIKGAEAIVRELTRR